MPFSSVSSLLLQLESCPVAAIARTDCFKGLLLLLRLNHLKGRIDTVRACNNS